MYYKILDIYKKRKIRPSVTTTLLITDFLHIVWKSDVQNSQFGQNDVQIAHWHCTLLIRTHAYTYSVYARRKVLIFQNFV